MGVEGARVENHKDIWSGKGNICLGDDVTQFTQKYTTLLEVWFQSFWPQSE